MKLYTITYGDSKAGKTLAALRAHPDALYVALRGALTCAKYIGVEPTVAEYGTAVKGVKDIVKLVKEVSHKYPAIVIDDFSIIADKELAACKQQTQGWAAFDVFMKRIYELQDVCRNADCHILKTMHQQAPKEVGQSGQKRWIKGGPMIGGWQLVEKLPAMCDVVARVVYDKSNPGWPYVYQTGPDPDYTTGDRLAISPEKFPLNLREMMLAADIDVPRPKEYEHLDAYVDALSKELLQEFAEKRPDVKRVLREALPSLSSVIDDPRHIRWVFADALDRASLCDHNNNLLDGYIQSL